MKAFVKQPGGLPKEAYKIKTYAEAEMPARLGDPCQDRKMPDVVAPFVAYLEDSQVFPVEGMPDWMLMV